MSCVEGFVFKYSVVLDGNRVRCAGLVSAVTGALKTVCCTGVHCIPAVVVFLLSRTLLIDSKGIF
jgi:hypothetical protein